MKNGAKPRDNALDAFCGDDFVLFFWNTDL